MLVMPETLRDTHNFKTAVGAELKRYVPSWVWVKQGHILVLFETGAIGASRVSCEMLVDQPPLEMDFL